MKITLLSLLATLVSLVSYSQYTAITYQPANNSTSSYTIDLSKPVGATPMSTGVGAMGNPEVSIPIQVPPGTRSMQPEVSINYTGGSINGVLGIGWNLAGISVISRGGKAKYVDGSAVHIKHTANDRYYFNGQRLILMAGTYGQNGSEYATELESWNKIEAVGTNASGPSWFRVKTRTGLTYEYGNDVDYNSDAIHIHPDGTTLHWYLSKVIDCNGNYIEYKYEQIDDQVLLKEINYTGNSGEGLAPYNSLSFSYGIRDDISKTYSKGDVNGRHKYVLTSIQVTGESAQVFKTYEFEYCKKENRTLLNAVYEKAASGAAINETIFRYGVITSDYATGGISNIAGAARNLVARVNKDGFSDVISFGAEVIYTGTSIAVFYDNYRLKSNDPDAPGNFINESAEIGLGTGRIFSSHNPARVADYNGDGMDEFAFITYNEPTTGVFTVNQVTSYFSPYTYTLGFQSVTGTCAAVNKHVPQETLDGKWGHLFHGEFNSDGRSDHFIITSDGASSNPDYSILLSLSGGIGVSNGGGTGSTMMQELNLSAAQSAYFDGAETVLPIDFDGDGTTELLVVNGLNSYVLDIYKFNGNWACALQHSNGFPTEFHKIFPGDFNGDGIIDLITSVKNTTTQNWEWGVSWGTGAGWTTPMSNTNGFSSTFGDPDAALNDYIIADFNSDGFADILRRESAGSAGLNDEVYTLRVSLGNDFVSQTLTSFGPDRDGGYLLGDFNGDGRADILSNTSASTNLQLVEVKAEGEERDLLEVKDGYGRRFLFEYGYLSEGATTAGDDLYDLNGSYGYPYQGTHAPLKVVKSHSKPDALDGFYTEYFSYEDLVFHLRGRGSLGFMKLSRSNNVNALSSISEFQINGTYQISELVSTESFESGTLIQSQEFQYVYNLLQNDPWHVERNVSQVTSINNTTLSKSVTSTTYNDGLPISTTVQKGMTLAGTDPLITTQTSVEGYHIACNGLIGAAPIEVTTTTTRLGELPFSKTVKYDYDVINGVYKTYEFYQEPKEKVTEVTQFDGFGNAVAITISAAGLPSRTISKQYDTKGRFPISTTNPLQQSATATFDAMWGVATSKTSVSGLVNSYVLDEWGRITQNVDPIGVTTNVSVHWDIGSGNGSSSTSADNSLYYVKTTKAGSPEVRSYYDRNGALRLKRKRNFSGTGWIDEVVSYDIQGRKNTTSSPFESAGNAVISTYSYDNLGRISSVVQSNGGGTVHYSYTSISQGLKVVLDPPGANNSVERFYDAVGAIDKVIDPGGTVYYEYYSHGGQREIKKDATVVNTMSYDDYARQTALWDISAGTSTYEYDAYGQLITQSQTANNARTFQYDVLGRMTQEVGPEGTTTYQYVSSGNGLNQLSSVIGNGESITYEYDVYGRQTAMEYVGKNVRGEFAYNSNGHLATRRIIVGQSADEMEFQYGYNSEGYLSSIVAAEQQGQVQTTIWTGNQMDAFGHYTQYQLGNGITSNHTYNNFGYPTNYAAGSIQDLDMSWDVQRGNLLSRSNNIISVTEDFDYDELDRLIEAQIGTNLYPVTYDNNGMGNIASKHDVGAMNYTNYQVTSIVNTGLLISTQTQELTAFSGTLEYNGFDEPEQIAEGNLTLDYSYGADFNRSKAEIKDNNVALQTREYYLALGYETVLDQDGASATNGTKFHLFYESVLGKTITLIVKESTGNGAWTTQAGGGYHYAYTDHLGSITYLTDDLGNLVMERSFDAWGRERNAADWTYGAYSGVYGVPIWMIRGYTGHEHLEHFDLIHMNGRLYDPLAGRMLSPDNYVQFSGTSQGLNRYSYGLNNPLKYTDPDGEIVFTTFVISSIIVGAVLGAYFGGSSSNGSMNPVDWNYNSGKTYLAMGIGAVVGGAAGLGFAFGAPSLAGTSFFSSFSNGTAAAYSLTGAAAGGATGLISGFFGGLLYSSGNLGYALEISLYYGAIGATIGGAIGFAFGSMPNAPVWNQSSTNDNIPEQSLSALAPSSDYDPSSAIYNSSIENRPDLSPIYTTSDLSFDGENLTWYDRYSDGSFVQRGNWSAISGPWGRGALPDGVWTTGGTISPTYNNSMVVDRADFAIPLQATFNLNGRRGFYIHPDGGVYAGTMGCIGLNGTSNSMLRFINFYNIYYSNYGSMNVNVR